MLIDSFPFIRACPKDPKKRPWLFIRITNPDADRTFDTVGLVDTGADECCMPACYADLLGHNLAAGAEKKINTGNGITTAYAHTCTVEVLTIDYPGEVFSIRKP